MVYGSYLTRLATPHSNLNLALNFPQEYSLGHALSQVTKVLSGVAIGIFSLSFHALVTLKSCV